MKRLISILFLLFFLTSCISYYITENDLFHPSKVSELNKDLTLEEVYFNTKDNIKLYGWFIKHENARGTILYMGGNGYYIWTRLTPDMINMLTSFDMNLMLIDYRGYGKSEGEPSIQGLFDDGYSAYEYLCSRDDVDSTKIVVYGHSYGTFIGTRLGNKHNAAGIILEGAISNTQDMTDVVLEQNAPWYLRWLVSIDADSSVKKLGNLEQLKKLSCPLLIVVGEKDNITPPEMGKKVYEYAASSIKEFKIIPNGEHKDLYFTKDDGRRDTYKNRVAKFLNKILDEK